MKQIREAMAAIFDAACYADVETKPTVTLTFNSRSDRYRFETTMVRSTDPLLGYAMIQGRASGEFELEGIVFKLAVRQVDAP